MSKLERITGAVGDENDATVSNPKEGFYFSRNQKLSS